MGNGLLDRTVSDEERELLRAMAEDPGARKRTRQRAQAVLAYADTGDLNDASEASGYTSATASKWIKIFNESGWQALLDIPSPRGGDFLARYDQGFWAERLTRVYLDQSRNHRAIPYGTSRSEPFTDLETFRRYAVSEALLQAWSHGERWKRPDLLIIPREVLVREKGNDEWTPDLKHWDNEECQEWIGQASAAVEVETSLWHVEKATKADVSLSYTVKEEDLENLRNWIRATGIPLYVIQVFYDSAYVLPFSRLEQLITTDLGDGRVEARVDPTTNKATYWIPLSEGTLLGRIPEPEVEGRTFIAPNGRVTVYGRLTGSQIEVANREQVEAVTSGRYGND